MSSYNKHILPYSGKNVFNIAINVSLVAVGEIDEIEEKLSTVLWLIYKWKDENIKWRQDENSITDITFGWLDVWKPVLRVENPHADSSNRQTSDRSFVSSLTEIYMY
ncbi:acetylcholine receptor subunit delta-like [Mercenaria mercenaria]|uniref:acetylcholine receptor subunit delta-like n=1 Tax=Mercenaria mercenaria TaxID=6596 RepID=UPI00234F1A62|nr:acetylcholine receptor subunit delta-like [Mercenaria mercenaria]